MKILVSNDDGYLATGINALTNALEQVADVTVVAPDGATADALASAANYLSRHGWQSDLKWGRRVRLPTGFDDEVPYTVGVADLEEGAVVLQILLEKYMPKFYRHPITSTLIEKYRSSLDGNAVSIYRLTPQELTAKENQAEDGRV